MQKVQVKLGKDRTTFWDIGTGLHISSKGVVDVPRNAAVQRAIANGHLVEVNDTDAKPNEKSEDKEESDNASSGAKRTTTKKTTTAKKEESKN